LQNTVLMLLLIICLATDLRERKIYNMVLIPALLFGLGYNFFMGSWPGLLQSIEGILAGLGLLIIPFAMGGMGGGDVKLLAVIGAVMGPLFVFYTALGMGLMGGIIAIMVLIYKGQAFRFLTSCLRGLWTMLTTGFQVIHFDFDHEKTTIPYGVAIAAGAIGSWLWMR
jgi:prepilin peptidase CpaA